MFGRRDRQRAVGADQRGHRSQASVRATIAAAPRAIWEVLARPGSAFPEESGIVNAFVAPGSGPGVGEVQIALYGTAETGPIALGAIVIEESRPPHYVRFRSLDRTGLPSSLSEINLTQRDHGTVVHYTVAVSAGSAAPLRSATVPSQSALCLFMLSELQAVARELSVTITPEPDLR